uniref:Ubiquitin carboxyl-terminal hydrolase n=1 Tax=Alexandrium monilatum TaxID=311494 RepID=A0A7S4PT56_9DINO
MEELRAGDGLAAEPGAEGGLLKAVAAQKAFLPRTISFVRASGSLSGSVQGTSVDPDRDGPVPPYYLYPRERLRALCESDAPRRVGRGLNNAGNTCFFNSVLQTLTYTRPLQNYLLSGEHARACALHSEGLFCALCLFERHAKEALGGSRSPVHPRALLKHLKQLGGKSIQLGRQEDAHEFLLHFLDACHKAALQPATQQSTVPPLVQRTTLIHQLFGGYLRSQVVCQECKHESNTFDPFLDLSLEVRTAATLEKALEGFTKSELVSGQNRYRCKKCEQPVDVTKRFSLHALPPLVMFQLKRFEFSQGARGKIIKNVSFGTSIDLARFTSHPNKEAKYRLYAVIVHQGHTAKSGHYFAFVRHCSGTWYHFNDEQVRAVSEQQVLRTQAYLLFYEVAGIPPDLRGGPVNGATANGTHPSNGFTSGGATSSSSSAGPKDASESAAANGKVNRAAKGTSDHPRAAGDAANGITHDISSGTHRLLPHAEGVPSSETLCESPRQTHGDGLAAPKLPEEGEEGETAPEASAEDEAGSETREEVLPRRMPHFGRLRRLHALWRRSKRRRASRMAVESPRSEVPAEEGAKVPALPEPAPARQRPAVRIADLAAASLVPDHKTQYGRAEVSRWEDDAAEGPSEAFLDAQRQLQPGPERRDELDTEYDVGKRKHVPKKPRPVFSGKNAFDKEQFRREQAKASRSKGRGRFGGEGHSGAGRKR